MTQDDQKDFVVFAPLDDGAFGVMRVPAGIDEGKLLNGNARLNGRAIPLSSVAFMHVPFHRAATKEDAIDIARGEGLSFIPGDWLAAAREGQTGLTMAEIRAAFAPRSESSPKEEINQSAFDKSFAQIFGTPHL